MNEKGDRRGLPAGTCVLMVHVQTYTSSLKTGSNKEIACNIYMSYTQYKKGQNITQLFA